MKVPNLPDRTQPSGFDPTYFDRQWSYIIQAVNGGLNFGAPSNTDSNFDGVWYKGVTPSAPDTEFTIPHKLGRIPTGWLLFSIDKAGIVYRGSGIWTKTSITLKCSTGSTNVVLLVI